MHKSRFADAAMQQAHMRLTHAHVFVIDVNRAWATDAQQGNRMLQRAAAMRHSS
jgi:hypothetical protein